MPKETIVEGTSRIVPARPATKDDPGCDEWTDERLGLSIGWNKAGWVQIHMSPPGWETTGDWHIVDLDRFQINRLIRMARKARDQAYGSDA